MNNGLWLRVQIDALYEDVLKKVEALYRENHPDVHCVACNQIADKWDIWERRAATRVDVHLLGLDDETTEMLVLPMWLMHMVSGAMREDRFASYREQV